LIISLGGVEVFAHRNLLFAVLYLQGYELRKHEQMLAQSTWIL